MSQCDICGQSWGKHYNETDNSKLLGLFGPVPAYEPPISWLVCPFVEEGEEI